MEDLGKLIVAKGLKTCPKFAQPGHTAPDQDMLAHDCSLIHPRLLGWSRFKHFPRHAYFILQGVDCGLETCMLLAGVKVHEIWWPRKSR